MGQGGGGRAQAVWLPGAGTTAAGAAGRVPQASPFQQPGMCWPVCAGAGLAGGWRSPTSQGTSLGISAAGPTPQPGLQAGSACGCVISRALPPALTCPQGCSPLLRAATTVLCEWGLCSAPSTAGDAGAQHSYLVCESPGRPRGLALHVSSGRSSWASQAPGQLASPASGCPVMGDLSLPCCPPTTGHPGLPLVSSKQSLIVSKLCQWCPLH